MTSINRNEIIKQISNFYGLKGEQLKVLNSMTDAQLNAALREALSSPGEIGDTFVKSNTPDDPPNQSPYAWDTYKMSGDITSSSSPSSPIDNIYNMDGIYGNTLVFEAKPEPKPTVYRLCEDTPTEVWESVSSVKKKFPIGSLYEGGIGHDSINRDYVLFFEVYKNKKGQYVRHWQVKCLAEDGKTTYELPKSTTDQDIYKLRTLVKEHFNGIDFDDLADCFGIDFKNNDIIFMPPEHEIVKKKDYSGSFEFDLPDDNSNESPKDNKTTSVSLDSSTYIEIEETPEPEDNVETEDSGEWYDIEEDDNDKIDDSNITYVNDKIEAAKTSRSEYYDIETDNSSAKAVGSEASVEQMDGINFIGGVAGGSFEIIPGEDPKRTTRRFTVALIKDMLGKLINEYDTVHESLGILNSGTWATVLGMLLGGLLDLCGVDREWCTNSIERRDRIAEYRDKIIERLNSNIDNEMLFNDMLSAYNIHYNHDKFEEMRLIAQGDNGLDAETRYQDCVAKFKELCPDNDISHYVETWEGPIIEKINNFFDIILMIYAMAKVAPAMMEKLVGEGGVQALSRFNKWALGTFTSATTMGGYNGVTTFANLSTNNQDLTFGEILNATVGATWDGVKMGTEMSQLEFFGISPIMDRLSPVLGKLTGGTAKAQKLLAKNGGTVSMAEITNAYKEAAESFRGQFAEQALHAGVTVPVIGTYNTLAHFNEKEYREMLMQGKSSAEQEKIKNMSSFELRLMFAQDQFKEFGNFEGISLIYKQFGAVLSARSAMKSQQIEFFDANMRKSTVNGKTVYEIVGKTTGKPMSFDGKTQFSSIESATSAYTVACTKLMEDIAVLMASGNDNTQSKKTQNPNTKPAQQTKPTEQHNVTVDGQEVNPPVKKRYQEPDAGRIQIVTDDLLDSGRPHNTSSEYTQPRLSPSTDHRVREMCTDKNGRINTEAENLIEASYTESLDAYYSTKINAEDSRRMDMETILNSCKKENGEFDNDLLVKAKHLLESITDKCDKDWLRPSGFQYLMNNLKKTDKLQREYMVGAVEKLINNGITPMEASIIIGYCSGGCGYFGEVTYKECRFDEEAFDKIYELVQKMPSGSGARTYICKLKALAENSMIYCGHTENGGVFRFNADNFEKLKLYYFDANFGYDANIPNAGRSINLDDFGKHTRKDINEILEKRIQEKFGAEADDLIAQCQGSTEKMWDLSNGKKPEVLSAEQEARLRQLATDENGNFNQDAYDLANKLKKYQYLRWDNDYDYDKIARYLQKCKGHYKEFGEIVSQLDSNLKNNGLAVINGYIRVDKNLNSKYNYDLYLRYGDLCQILDKGGDHIDNLLNLYCFDNCKHMDYFKNNDFLDNIFYARRIRGFSRGDTLFTDSEDKIMDYVMATIRDKKPTNEETGAIADYKADSYEDINTRRTPYWQKQGDILESYIRSHTLNFDNGLRVVRGDGSNECLSKIRFADGTPLSEVVKNPDKYQDKLSKTALESLSGQSFINERFVSTTAMGQGVFQSPIHWELELESGTQASIIDIPIAAGEIECEFLINRNSQFTIKEVDVNGEFVTIKATVTTP